VVTNLEDAHEQIDTAIATALRESKPVYLSISCNLPGLPHPTFSRDPVPFFLSPRYCLSLILRFIGYVAWIMKLSPPKLSEPAMFYINPRAVTYKLKFLLLGKCLIEMVAMR